MSRWSLIPALRFYVSQLIFHLWQKSYISSESLLNAVSNGYEISNLKICDMWLVWSWRVTNDKIYLPALGKKKATAQNGQSPQERINISHSRWTAWPPAKCLHSLVRSSVGLLVCVLHWVRSRSLSPAIVFMRSFVSRLVRYFRFVRWPYSPFRLVR